MIVQWFSLWRRYNIIVRSIMQVSPARASYCLGDHTLKVPIELHTQNRARLCAELKKTGKVTPSAWVVLKGGDEQMLYSSDVGEVFRQESYFHWTFGVLSPGCYGAVRVSDGFAIVFIPRLSSEYAIWMGRIPTTDEVKNKCQASQVNFTDEILTVLGSFKPDTLLTLRGMNTDSGLKTLEADFDGIKRFNVNVDILHDVIAECRVYKSPIELDIIRYTNCVSSKAHKEVMKRIRPNMKEYQVEAIFRYYCYYYGACRHVSYTNICGTGHNCSVLHYGHADAPNDKTIEEGDMCLFDMGGEYYGYTSDITCSFPVSGKFTPKQRAIYETVLKAARAVRAGSKPGASWVDLHLLANRVTLEELKKHGLVKGDVDEMMKVHLGAVFQPHGLGHLMGMNVHDVGGYLPGHPERRREPGLKSLRTARILKPNMVLTIEPGCYFIDHQLDQAYADPARAKFLVKEKIEQYRGFGGVRIEDNIAVTETGCELMTKVPRDVDDIEKLMAEGRKLQVEVPQAKDLVRLLDKAE